MVSLSTLYVQQTSRVFQTKIVQLLVVAQVKEQGRLLDHPHQEREIVDEEYIAGPG